MKTRGKNGEMMRRGFFLFAILLVFAASAALSQKAGAADAPALYTAAQANAGGQIFAQQCATCHGASMEGVAGPALRGTPFHQLAQAQDLNAQSLLTVVSQSMPQDNPASLTPAQYGALVAYILQQNGYPAGGSELSAGNQQLKDLNLGH
jgi:polar amino acid transport system substrate-binding protein